MSVIRECLNPLVNHVPCENFIYLAGKPHFQNHISVVLSFKVKLCQCYASDGQKNQGNEADLAEVLERVTKTGQILVVDYYAPWCRACQKLLRYMYLVW